ncbi:hypothetical protein ALC56_09380 [Trachymyrmex septentrionalis]|uniref:Uncharacterized protein n=1 Tax=Trachymyrmex septentrionalis TaxID=34720 RepID=A0A195F740_9HYME|nr:hypothetical protein ALC56_09380 [Trachymyrmex septentrionalis]
MARGSPSRYPLEVLPTPADFYSSHTGFVYNFVPFARSSRYAIDPMMYLSGGDGVVVVIRDSLLYAVTWQARKGRLEIPGSRHGASSYNSTRMRTSSRIGITITTYIYVGESLESQEDPFTARNREFRVTLRGPKRRHWILWFYTCIGWILYCKLLLACK